MTKTVQRRERNQEREREGWGGSCRHLADDHAFSTGDRATPFRVPNVWRGDREEVMVEEGKVWSKQVRAEGRMWHIKGHVHAPENPPTTVDPSSIPNSHCTDPYFLPNISVQTDSLVNVNSKTRALRAFKVPGRPLENDGRI